MSTPTFIVYSSAYPYFMNSCDHEPVIVKSMVPTLRVQPTYILPHRGMGQEAGGLAKFL